ncbi:MAG: RDD family protein [Nocardioides sp.]|nr:RDD family protein [Nocardioides sp.]
MSNYPPPGEPGYGHDPYAQPAYGYGAPAVAYAHWGKRVGAYLIDSLVTMLVMIPYYIGIAMVPSSTDPVTGLPVQEAPSALAWVLMAIGIIGALAFFVWNWCIKQGRTGYTIGKGVLGIKLVGDQTGQPIGAGMSFARQIVHIVDSLPCYLGYLWPLWDAKRQTFADKILKSVVIDQPKG